MSVELVSIGHYDFSVFDLSSHEEKIISLLIKHDISNYLITKNTYLNSIEFFMNSTLISQDNALSIFSDIFDLLEKDYLISQKGSFTLSVLQHSFYIDRTFDKEKPENVTWSIKTDNLFRIKKELFDFFHKSIFYHYLKDKLKEKKFSDPLKKI